MVGQLVKSFLNVQGDLSQKCKRVNDPTEQGKCLMCSTLIQLILF